MQQAITLAFRHQVDVELVDADRLELAQLRNRLLLPSRGRVQNRSQISSVTNSPCLAPTRCSVKYVELARFDVVGEHLQDDGAISCSSGPDQVTGRGSRTIARTAHLVARSKSSEIAIALTMRLRKRRQFLASSSRPGRAPWSR